MNNFSPTDRSTGRTTSAGFFLLALLIAVAFGGYSASAGDGGLQMSLLAFIVMPAILLAVFDSRFLVPYILAVWTFGPELRRVVDWSEGQFNSLSVLSLAPLLATLTLAVPILRKRVALPLSLRKFFFFMSVVFGYGMLIGVIHTGLAVFYDLASYALPLLVLLYAARRRDNPRERDFWIASFSFFAVVVALYGWAQYLFAPDWDVFWMKATNLGFGKPLPLQIRVYSTLNAPGVAGMFLEAALAAMLLRKEWRGWTGWPGVFLVASALGITLVRSAWLALTVTLVAYLLLVGGRNRGRLIGGIAVAGGVLYLLAPLLPGAETVTARVQTVGAISKDESFNARADFSTGFLSQLVSTPLGIGFGSVGVGSKIGAGGALSGQYLNFDNGYIAIFFIFGIGGGSLFFYALWLLFQAVRTALKTAPQREYAALALASLASSLVIMTFANVFSGVSALLIWFFVSCCFGAQRRAASPKGEIIASPAPLPVRGPMAANP